MLPTCAVLITFRYIPDAGTATDNMQVRTPPESSSSPLQHPRQLHPSTLLGRLSRVETCGTSLVNLLVTVSHFVRRPCHSRRKR